MLERLELYLFHHHIAEPAAASPEKSKKATEESKELEQKARKRSEEGRKV